MSAPFVGSVPAARIILTTQSRLVNRCRVLPQSGSDASEHCLTDLDVHFDPFYDSFVSVR